MMLPHEAASLLGNGPISAKPYFDENWWELERNAIFMRHWLYIAHVCELPGNGSFIRREVEFARASLLIVRGKDGQLRTFHNACTHRGTELTQERCGKQSKFSCPYHKWTFGTDGELLSAPDFERFGIPSEAVALKQVHTEVLAGMIFVNFDREPKESLRGFLGPVADELEMLPIANAVAFTEYTYEVPANWKTNFDNFQETYHLRFLHQSAAPFVAGPENPFGYPTHYGFSGPHRTQLLWLNPEPPSPPEISVLGMTPGLRFAAEESLDFPSLDLKLFPNFQSVSLIAGQQYTHTHFPLGPERTRGVVRHYWTNEADCASRLFFREYSLNSLRDILCEDRHAVESAQRGISSGAIKNFHLQEHEALVRHMYEEVVKRVRNYAVENGHEISL
jgi:phenylpropionate dioxygenase-like ring-hydroxylating dioxygenase large terminal subunit